MNTFLACGMLNKYVLNANAIIYHAQFI